MSSLMQKLAAAAVRNRVISSLRQHCPETLRPCLEELLADAASMNVVEAFVMAALKDRRLFTLDHLLALDLSEQTRRLFDAHPDLPAYLLSLSEKLGDRR